MYICVCEGAECVLVYDPILCYLLDNSDSPSIVGQ